MPDEDALTDVERHVRAALRPADDRVRDVVSGALSAERENHPRRLQLVGAGLVALAIIAAVVWRALTPPAPALHISGSGSVVVVTSDDGRRWVVDAQGDSTVRGGYVIAFPQ